MNVTQGNLTIVGANTQKMQVFWNGKEIKGVISLGTEYETKHDRDPDGENRVKIRVETIDAITSKEMSAAGITVKLGRGK